MPDTYTSQFSGEEIDSALRAAQIISGASTPAELREKLEIRGDTIPVSATDPTPVSEALTASGGGVNPNLLDNPLFQVWQKYSDGSYTGVPDNIYIADRWLILSSDGSKTNTVTKVSPYGIKNESGASLRIQQRLENAAQYNGMTLTLSILYGNGNLCSATLLASDWTDKTDIFDLFIKKANSDRMGWLLVGDVWLAAKLELGSTQTLAHKENGVWVLNEVPDYGEQLARCLRYLVRYDFNSQRFFGVLNVDNENGGQGMIFTPVPMRTTPTIIGNLGAYSTDNNLIVTPSVMGTQGGLVWLNASITNTKFVNTPKSSLLFTPDTLYLSADL